MSRRWCIIAGPRSGSTWLENMIFKKIKSLDSRTEMLTEVLEPSLNLNYIIDDYKNLKINGCNKNPLIISELIDDRIKLIQNVRDDQPMTMRIFPKNEIYSESKFWFFLYLLKQKNFNFVSLNRDLFDRSISLYMMYETKIIHRWGDTKYSTINSNGESDLFLFEKEAIKPKIIKINIDKFKDILESEYITEKNITNINLLLECKTVEYKNLIENSKNNDIPININVNIRTTYDIEYKDIIENYDEVLSMYEEFKTRNFKI